MKCPNCNLNIKDDAEICIHCGMTFQNYAVSTPTNPNNPTPSVAGIPIAKNNISNKEKYLRAYAGKKYDKLIVNKFSIGTLLLGCIWLLFNKLYEAAWILFVKIFITSFIITLLVVFLATARIYIPFSGLINFIICFAITFNCARDYSVFYLQKANNQVSKIVYSTADEEERIKKCKAAGRPLYIALILPILIIVLYGAFAALISSVYYRITNYINTLGNTNHNQASVSYDKESAEIANLLQIEVDTNLNEQNYVTEENKQLQNKKYYYIVLDNDDQNQNYAFSELDENFSHFKGYIFIYYLDSNQTKYYVCIRNKKNLKRVVINKKDATKYFLGVKDEGLCNYKLDIPKYYDAKKLVKKEN